MICRFADLSICRFVDFCRNIALLYITSPQPPSKGEPIHEHHTNDYEHYTSNYEDYTSDLLINSLTIGKLTHWQISN